MPSRHGKVARTPISPRDPRVLDSPQPTPPAPAGLSGGRAGASREELRELAQALLDQPTYHQQIGRASCRERV